MKTRTLLIGILVILASISAITFILPSFNQTPDTSFYYGGIGLPENDKLCFATLTIHNTTLTLTELEKIVRLEISNLGSQYDFEERKVDAKQISQDTIAIEIGGSWRTIDSTDRPNLLGLLSPVIRGTVDDRHLITCY